MYVLYLVDLKILSIALILGSGPKGLGLVKRIAIQTIHSGFVRQLNFYHQARIDET